MHTNIHNYYVYVVSTKQGKANDEKMLALVEKLYHTHI